MKTNILVIVLVSVLFSTASFAAGYQGQAILASASQFGQQSSEQKTTGGDYTSTGAESSDDEDCS